MTERTIDFYIEAFGKMNRAVVRGVKAPHKPLLLLSILYMVRKGDIIDNHILLSNVLMSEFKRMWAKYIGKQEVRDTVMVADGLAMDIHLNYPFKCSIENPYYHLQHEPFWKLIRNETVAPRKSYTSIKALREAFLYAEIDNELIGFMKCSESYSVLERALHEVL